MARTKRAGGVLNTQMPDRPVNLTGAPGVYDRYPVAPFDKPRSTGPNSLPEKIMDGTFDGVVPKVLGQGGKRTR